MNTPFPFPNVFLSFPNRVLLRVLSVGILLIPVSFLLKEHINGINVMTECLILYSGLSLMLRNGKFAFTKSVQYINFSIAALLIAAMMRVMHWFGADILFAISIASISIIYTVYFFLVKKQYNLMSLLKLLFLHSYLATQTFMVFHLPNKELVYFAFWGVFTVTVAIYLIQNFSLLKNT